MSLCNEMNRLSAMLDDLLEIVPPNSTIALIDAPVNRNIGDQLLQRGSEAFFDRHNIEIAFRANTYNYSTRRARAMIPPEAIIVCQGGGNMGDLYPHHQNLREKVIQDFPAHRIAVLPQSVYFRNPAAENRARAVFSTHERLHLCLRDQSSFDIASSWFCCSTLLIPDMAHALWPIANHQSACEQQAETLYVIRQDHEQISVPESFLSHRDDFIDWKDLTGHSDTALMGIFAAGFTAERYGLNTLPLGRLLNCHTDRLVRCAIRLMTPYRQVVTSRLHGVLLGLLLGKRVVILDSLTGKCQAYHSTWLKAIKECHMAGE